MKGMFSRMSPARFAESIGIPLGWMVISWRWMPDLAQRRRAHGKWFRIKSKHGVVYRVLRFSTKLSGSPPDTPGEVVIDWPAWLELSGYAEKMPDSLELEFEKADIWHLPQLAASHPDPATRLSGILGLVSVFLGSLSIVLALLLAS